MNELVSIIIPLYNRSLILFETLDSILAQSYTNFECILVDDGSTDNSLEIAYSYAIKDSRIKVFTRPSNVKKGANTCRNIGFLKSNGTYIHWFDSDDIMLPKMIENKVKSFLENNSDVTICKAAFFNNSILDHHIDDNASIIPKTNNPSFELISSNFKIQTSQVMILRSYILKEKNLFNKNLSRNQETEYFVRLFLNNPKFSYVQNVDVLIRVGNSSITSTFHSNSEERKHLINFIGYFEMYNSFKNANKTTPEVILFFSDYFNRCLRKMEVDRKYYSKLFVYGITNNWFPSGFNKYKIFIKRYFSSSN
jgi:glycosyltransferase involved in cell wall biosynthesis